MAVLYFTFGFMTGALTIVILSIVVAARWGKAQEDAEKGGAVK